jgi:hypothetical protein
MIMYRPPKVGGLGVHHVQSKALAMLIRSFLETAANPKFLHSLFHSCLYRYHVLLQRDLPDPGLTPYYSADFFATIRKVHETTPLNVSTLTSSQWYTLLLKDNVTMSENQDIPRNYISSRAELASPENDWEHSWQLARLPGLGPDITTFLWRLLHRLLPTQERLLRMSKSRSAQCQLCHQEANEDLQHAFFHCQFNQIASHLLLQCLSTHSQGISERNILILGFQTNSSNEFPLVWFVGNFLYRVWISRIEKKQVQPYSIRAELEARASLLRETRHSDDAIQIGDLIELCFRNS